MKCPNILISVICKKVVSLFLYSHYNKSSLNPKTAGDYEEVANVTIYSTVNQSPAANQIQDPLLYSTVTISPETGCKLTGVESVSHAAKGFGPRTIIGSEDNVTYETVHFPKVTF